MTFDKFLVSDLCRKKVLQEMIEYVKPFVTPISCAITNDSGELAGSGSYIEINGFKYLITNEHVLISKNSSSFTYQFCNNDSVFKITNPIATKEYPVDIAIVRIENAAWNSCIHDSKAIPECFIDLEHNPVENELIFTIGFSGEQATFGFNTLFTQGTQYLTQEANFPKDYDSSEFHFAIHYLPDQAVSVNINSRGLTDAHGISGSLVWNTKFIECTQNGNEWKADRARVTGIIWGWSTTYGCLKATKTEFLKIAEICSSYEKIIDEIKIKLGK